MTRSGRALITGLVSISLWVSMLAIGTAQQPIRIGASISQTGPYSAPGQNQLRGYRLCVKHTNEKGGVLGRKLELVVEDDQSQPATAARIYERSSHRTGSTPSSGPTRRPSPKLWPT